MRGKAEVTVVAMVLVTLALILYILSTSDMRVDSLLSKERNTQPSALVQKAFSVNDVNRMTLSDEGLASHNTAEKHIMDDIRRDSDQDENNLVKKVLAPQKQEDKVMYINKVDNHVLGRHSSVLSNAHRIVHLDLKGAPPLISFYEELFPLIRSLGATGVLVEYEDMFPYSGILKELAANNAYTKSGIKRIIKLANHHGLEIIPLIQTFGHLEFLLKSDKFSHLREVPKYPQVVCPSNNDTFPILTEMISQIIELHPHIKYLHIGCDEVYHLGQCILCTTAMSDHKWSKTQLFLNHVVRVAKYIRKHYPKVMPLTWDDEFRKLSETELRESGVSQWLEPVVWKYTPDISLSIGPEIWEKYISIFPAIWVASAFKGATGPDKYVTNISYHLENHHAWMNVISLYSNKIKLRGMILTGWQRYDHFAVLCELLPVGLPSLAANLAYIQGNNKDMSEVLKETLKCESPVPLSPGMGTPDCSFPGAGVFVAAERLRTLQQNVDQLLSESIVKGWFTAYNIEHSFSNPALVENAADELEHFKMELMYIQKDMITAMSEVFDSYTIREWVKTYIRPLDKKLQSLWDGAEKLLAQKHWPKRPLDLTEDNEERSSEPSVLSVV